MSVGPSLSQTPFHPASAKESSVIELASKQDAVDAARILPANRTTEQQALVDDNKAYQEVRNADFEAKEYQRKHGA